ncbi:hypothetical protein DFP72DRAFT_909513 [Ephemerocybe angulata]|uniref:Microbial-type PARG catalytic domain-containing protein n=1 Tax=Ephemerocybe angulata TaxID=980116 RepID=A0A8H6M3I4_9AGAR|nr:hypothetical protein DFP72DRAFT_909513 [Tulosesus angulatus]
MNPTSIVAIGMGVGTVLVGAFKKVAGGGSESSSDRQDSTPSRSSPPSKKTEQPNQQQARSSASEHAGVGRRDQQPGPRYQPKKESPTERRKRVADATDRAMKRGSYEYRSQTISLQPGISRSIEGTQFLGENSDLINWKKKPQVETQGHAEATVSILNISTLDAARILSNSYRFLVRDGRSPPKTGVLNFASATKPGGGVENGAEAQEESIARVSTLMRSLRSKEGQKFYETHRRNNNSHYYTHSMIFSPGVIVFHNDSGDAVDQFPIEVVSSPAVNAGLILEGNSGWQTAQTEVEIEAAMNERMGRILYLFELHGIRNIVLGTFGTGVFKNKVQMVARIWAKLLLGEGRFKFSFDRVIFAVTGDSTFAEFKGYWEGWVKQQGVPRAARGIQRSEWQECP